MKSIRVIYICLMLVLQCLRLPAQDKPDQINFVRQGVKRMIFDKDQSITLSALKPGNIVGLDVMHPVRHAYQQHAQVAITGNSLTISSKDNTETSIWLGGFNPFATFSLDVNSISGDCSVGFEFADAERKQRMTITVDAKDSLITGAKLKVFKEDKLVIERSIATIGNNKVAIGKTLILQMLGSGLMLYSQTDGLPKVIAQADFSQFIDLRLKEYLNTFHTSVFVALNPGKVSINSAEAVLTPGMGLADIRTITYEDGDPMIDQGQLWYTMSIRGRGLPHPLQGVFSMNPTAFDIKFEGIIVFDKNDGLLRNEVASHIFFDRKDKMWRGVTTGFSAYANPEKEKKQLLIIESKQDPRRGFSVMKASPFQIVGDMEDPQMIYDAKVKKWRMIACKNQSGYKAFLFESDKWDNGYQQIAGPVAHNSTGTSLQRIGGKLYAFSGSNENKLFVYSYPEMKEAGTLKMDLPPWNETSGSRVWPNVIQLPDGYPFKYIALTMDRYNYPGIQGQNWTYGAIYLYHGW